MKIQIDQLPGSSDYFFQIVADNGSVLMVSDSYPNRDACTEAVRNTINRLEEGGNLTKTGTGANTVIQLNDENGNVLVKSEAGSEANANRIIKQITDDVDAQDEYEVTVTSTTGTRVNPLPSFLGNAFTDFESLYSFNRASVTGNGGLELFNDADAADFLFHFNDDSGKPILFSRSFNNTSRRKKRIIQVVKNAVRDDKYDLEEKDGKYYFILNGSNGQEIGRSPLFDSEADRINAIRYLMGKMPEYKEEYSPKKRTRKKKAINQYNLEVLSNSGDEGFESFKNKEDRQHYFHFNDSKAAALLFSQGYSSIKSRDNGIRSVIKNGGNRARYELKEADGRYYFVLKAGNRQEIARSRYFATEADANQHIDYLVGSVDSYALKFGVGASEMSKTETETFTIAYERPPEPVVAEAPKSEKVIDDYLPCNDYAVSKESGFHKFFREDRKEYYFSYLNKEGEVVLRSEGYTTSKARDNGIESVKKNAPIEKRWIKDSEMNGKYHYYALRAGNNQEIARSCYFEDEAGMLAAFGWITGAFMAVAAAVSKPKPAVGAAVIGAGAAAAATATPPPPKPEPKVVVPPPVENSGCLGSWWKWLIPLLLLLGLAYLLFRGCDTQERMAPPPPPQKSTPVIEEKVESTPRAIEADPALEAPKKLGPNAADLGYASTSFAGRLADFLSSPDSKMPFNFRLENVNFDTDKDLTKTDAREVLNRVARVLNEYPTVQFKIEGHTDNRASIEYNLDLSKRRAISVGNYLQNKGISSSRFTTQGFGESRPIASNDTREGQYENRRVELSITKR